MYLLINPELSKFLIVSTLIAAAIFAALYFVLKHLGKSPKNILPINIAERIRIPLALLLISLVLKLNKIERLIAFFIPETIVVHISTILLIIAIIWLAIIAVKVFKHRILENYDISTTDNIAARRV